MSNSFVKNSFLIKEEIKSLFNNESYSDVTFQIGDEKLFGHKLILSLGTY